MNAVQQWAFSVCAAAVAAGIARMLLPGAGLEKMFTLTVSVFFLCCLLSPLALRDPGLNLDIGGIVWQQSREDGEQLRELADQQALELARNSIHRLIRDKLTQLGINAGEITINITTNGQNNVVIEEVVILLDDRHKSRNSEIRSALREELGLDVQIAYA